MSKSSKVRRTKTKKVQAQLLKQNVGVDLSKEDFKACFQFKYATGRIVIKGSKTFKNTHAGFKNFITWLSKKQDADLALHVTMEATGVYYEQLAYFLNSENIYKVSVVLPNTAKAYMKSLNLKSKTDKIDAKALGQMGLERELSLWQPLSDKMRTIKQLSRHRVSLNERKTAIENQLHAQHHSFIADSFVIKDLKEQCKLIKQQIKTTDKHIEAAVNADKELKERIDNVCTVKGLGLVTVACIVAEYNGFATFTNRGQVISFAGYDVVQRESGTSVKGKTRISKKGNKFVRRALFFPSFTAVQYEKRLTNIYNNVFDKTQIKMKGYVAVQRKLLLLIYALFTKNCAYDPNFLNRTNKDNLNKTESNELVLA